MTDVEFTPHVDHTGNMVYIEEGEVFHPKLKGDCGTIDVDTRYLSEDAFKAIFVAGLEAIINKVGQSKLLAGITKLEGEEKEKRTQEVKEQAEKTVQVLYAGSVKSETKAKKASSAVETEAMRHARNMANDLIRQNGQVPSKYTAKERTIFAKAILEKNHARLIELAEKSLAEREEGAKTLNMPGLSQIFGAKATSEKVKAKPRTPPKRKATGDKAPLSAAQASKVAPRQKPTQHLAH